ncbi:hypothetical protein HSX37_10670|uniref:Outer membrane protein beta-barrel domain-containing protein n=1 Tax=Dendrosporobacter quercicolus TaxID=146817 RepID=A0A1G9T3D8_9FIRM|nr:hypothetical protein [Dendrosporobacter quercicolus]NSL48494.1 hypothetical protein [Dendrosporobacter quercicolus DSM 1736]SDM42142.1 hypothetical protein SAMN04488502_104199 [Dendrosporobacter quercicolus]
MRKEALIFFVCLFGNIAPAWAAPINNLDVGSSAYGVMWGTKSNTYYGESQVTETLAIGVQSTVWKNSHTVNEFFGQFDIDDQTKTIIGTRYFDSKTRAYLGVALATPVNFEWTTYLSAMIGKGFHELTAGASYQLSDNTDIDFSYRHYRYHHNKDSIMIGLTYKTW